MLRMLWQQGDCDTGLASLDRLLDGLARCVAKEGVTNVRSCR